MKNVKLTDTKTMLEMIIDRKGWVETLACMQNICDSRNLAELSREFENLIVNYVPEVRS